MSQQPSTSSSLSSTRPNPGDVKEYNFRFPKNQRKKYSVMQFNRNDNVDLSKWKQAKMERENNKIHYKTDLDDLPKFGAGSEFGRERREEARQKKYGIIAQKYREEDQPWILKQGGPDGKTTKKYRGRKEGSVNENSSYFILSQLSDGTFEAYPVDSWYNFTAMQTYKTLNAEEAEEEFGRRDKTMNFFSVMVQKKLRDNKDDEDKEEATSIQRKNSDLTLMEDDYFLSSGEEMEDSDDDEGGGKPKPKKKSKGKSKKPARKRPKKKDLDSEAEEESDEGDFDGREYDYISEQSSEDDEMELAKTDIKGLDQELQQMEDEEEEEEEQKKEKKESKEGAEKLNDSKDGKERKSDGDSSSSESSGSDSDIDEKNIQSAMLLQKKHGRKSNEKTPSKSGSGSHSRSQTPTVPDVATNTTLSDAAKRLESKDPSSKKRLNPTESPATKRPRTESPVPGSAGNKTPSGHVPLTEEEVKRYLMRRPMTTKDLLVKLNPKRTGLPKEQIETKLAEILVKLAPEKRKKEKKIYWFIREHSK